LIFSCIFVCVYIYIYTNSSIYAHVWCTLTSLWADTSILTRILKPTCKFIYIAMQTCIFTYNVHGCFIFAYIWLNTYIYPKILVYTCIYIHVYLDVDKYIVLDIHSLYRIFYISVCWIDWIVHLLVLSKIMGSNPGCDIILHFCQNFAAILLQHSYKLTYNCINSLVYAYLHAYSSN
jgi:hypothetical protein